MLHTKYMISLRLDSPSQNFPNFVPGIHFAKVIVIIPDQNAVRFCNNCTMLIRISNRGIIELGARVRARGDVGPVSYQEL